MQATLCAPDLRDSINESLSALVPDLSLPRFGLSDERFSALADQIDTVHHNGAIVNLIALIVGGLGVGATMQSHLRQKMTNIAFMKCIGGRSEHILYIYLAQALWLGILGSVLGAVLGAFAQAVFARLLASYFDVTVTLIWPTAAMLQGVVAGLLTAMTRPAPGLEPDHVGDPWQLVEEALLDGRQRRTGQGCCRSGGGHGRDPGSDATSLPRRDRHQRRARGRDDVPP